MKVLTDSNYDGGDITHVDIHVRSVGKMATIVMTRPYRGEPIEELTRPTILRLVFDSSLELNSFIEAILKFQNNYREESGRWEIMK